MYVTLLVVLCLDLAKPDSCVIERVADQDSGVTISGCQGVEGMESAIKFWQEHPLYHTWQFKGWACQIGNKPAPDRGGA